MAEGIKDLKEALDESSRLNRRLFLLFLVFLVYALVTVASTTDLLLLIPDSKVKLPVVNVELPLFGFFIVAPLFIIVFHFNLLFNLVQHSIKLSKWGEEKEDKDNFLIFPFIFNFTVKYKETSITHYLLKTVIWVTTYLFPLLILLFIQVKFSAYHSLPMTFWHVTALMIDIFLIFLYWHRITKPDLSTEDSDSLRNLFQFHKERGLLRPIKSILISLITLRFIIRIIKLPISFIKGIKILFKPKELFSRIKHLIEGFETIPLWIIVLISYVNLTILILLFLLDMDYLNPYRFIVPHLELEEKTLVAAPPSEEMKQQYVAMGKEKEKVWIDYAEGLNLQNRDLRYANFYRSNLFKVDLRSANLQEATLLSAKLQGADLSNANLQGADLGHAKLQGAYLEKVEFGCVDLRNAKLQGILFENLDIKYNLNWDELLKYTTPMIPEKAKNDFIKRINEAKKRCKNYKEEKFPELKSNLHEFIEIRKKLACEDIYQAKGMLRQSLDDDKTTEEIRTSITGYMKSNCPDTLK